MDKLGKTPVVELFMKSRFGVVLCKDVSRTKEKRRRTCFVQASRWIVRLGSRRSRWQTMISLSLLFPAWHRKLKRREINRRYWQRLRSDPERCARVLKERYIPWSRSRRLQAPRVHPATDQTMPTREHVGQGTSTTVAETSMEQEASLNTGLSVLESHQAQTKRWPENMWSSPLTLFDLGMDSWNQRVTMCSADRLHWPACLKKILTRRL